MNHCVPDWNMEDDLRFHDLLPLSNQKNSGGADNDLVELLWRNGHVVMQSQTNRKPPLTIGEQKQASKYESPPKYGGPLSNSSTLIQEDETASWFQYPPLGDSLEKEFCSEFFSEIPTVDTLDANKLNKDVMIEEGRYGKVGAANESNLFTMPPPKSHTINPTQLASSLENVGVVNFSHFSRPMKTDLGSLKLGNGVVVRGGESSSMRTVGSSACGSNQLQNQTDASHTVSNGATGTLIRGAKEGIQMSSPREGVQTITFDTTVTSSSGGSGCSFGRNAGQQSASNQTHKRKGRDGEDSECHSEEADYESTEPNRPSQRSASARKSRAAEVHNLSERRRRDRINEKMKALQELIPHCNKSDKASMLDEAIEYLKSLQLQLQIMWMGSGMAPMMFPAVQQYMSRVGIGMGHASIPSINSLIQLQRGPLVNHSMSSTPSTNQTPMCPSPSLNAVNFPNQMQNAHHPESYAHCLGFPHMQLAPQTMNLYNYGSHMAQPNQTAGAAGSSSLPTSGVPSGNIQNGQSG